MKEKKKSSSSSTATTTTTSKQQQQHQQQQRQRELRSLQTSEPPPPPLPRHNNKTNQCKHQILNNRGQLPGNPKEQFSTERKLNLTATFAQTTAQHSCQRLRGDTEVQVVATRVCWLVGCSTSQQHASVSHGRICSDNFTCCHTEIEVAVTQYTYTGPTSPSTDPITPGAWQGSHWSANFCHWYDSTPKKSRRKQGFEPGIFRSRGGHLNH